jgi:hypothetical protein
MHGGSKERNRTLIGTRNVVFLLADANSVIFGSDLQFFSFDQGRHAGGERLDTGRSSAMPSRLPNPNSISDTLIGRDF